MKRIIQLVGAACVVTAIAVFGAEVASADTQSKAFYIINGQDDHTRAVGAFVNVNGESFCTGTLVSPTAILTAAHCFEFGLDGDGFFIGANAQDPSSGISIPIKSVHLHPTYMTDGEADIAVAILSKPATVRPLSFNRQAMTETWVGRQLVFVGYGLQNLPPRSPEEEERFTPQEGTRKAVEIPIVEIMPTAFKYAAQGKNTCFGDSGGPAFTQVDGKLVVVGVTSWGDDFCSEFGVNTRVDTYLDFVNKYVKESAETPSPAQPSPQTSAGEPSAQPQQETPEPHNQESTPTPDRTPDTVAGHVGDVNEGCAASENHPTTPLILGLTLLAMALLRRRHA